VFLVNSRQEVFCCSPTKVGQALSRSYGRLFAEFLREESPVHLRLLASPTGVGLRYGLIPTNLRRFSWRSFPFHFPCRNREFSLRVESSQRMLGRVPRICLRNLSAHEHESNNMRNVRLPVTPSNRYEGTEY
jgi:hypothetical protein